MLIHLPIADITVNILTLLGLGGLGGVLAGMFGIGGGFLVTPLLMFIGIPPAVAVATATNQIIASSVSGFLAHWHRNNVDIKMGIYLLIGGLIGSLFGVQLFTKLKNIGQIDLAISLFYVFFLGIIGILMAIESGRSIMNTKKGQVSSSKKTSKFDKLRSLPYAVTKFERSELEISLFLPIFVGIVAGTMVALMGIGGGFVMIPAMIYILGMPTSIVVGTSLFQIIFTTSLVTILHAINTQSVDILLAFILILGGVIGAQFGTVIGLKIPAEKLRILLALMVIAVCVKLGMGLFLEPDNLFSVTVTEAE